MKTMTFKGGKHLSFANMTDPEVDSGGATDSETIESSADGDTEMPVAEA